MAKRGTAYQTTIKHDNETEVITSRIRPTVNMGDDGLIYVRWGEEDVIIIPRNRLAYLDICSTDTVKESS